MNIIRTVLDIHTPDCCQRANGGDAERYPTPHCEDCRCVEVAEFEVQLTYFKPSGKYYSDGSYKSSAGYLHRIWDEVRQLRAEGRLPGVSGADYIVYVDVPYHPHRHPYLVTL